ncbi:hypothetical protein FJT64_004886 [Amphibalanus amphitrite]|uniref:Uncharacterized protein n=1 Tax=Amphibalanus amphitrite TaxID=1232801 RepID=A0A6A4VXT6_AMPAM|nr:translation initiation factor IF-2-like [Amphibalanus amphitrite]KAF0297679.1 hypothetical protein FJT64_004886 [Amphibalanus amphitrite]
MSKVNMTKARPPEPRLPPLSMSGLYRALDYEYRHPATLHPVIPQERRPAPTGHSCQPAVLDQRRRAAQLQRFLGEAAAGPAPTAVPGSAGAGAEPGSERGVGCAGRPAAPAPAPSRLDRLAAAVRESRRQPRVEGADLDQALAGRHPLHETARRLLQRVKEDNELLQLPAGRRAGSSGAGSAGRSLAAGGRRGHLTSARVGGDERERRKRMFSILYQ